ncbi:MAG: hypothetical protein CL946_06135 [Ectothiorhodospiraceae bacterium]|nr:hypothetical protein [Ectothiorhodospiraceae bacterium]
MTKGYSAGYHVCRWMPHIGSILVLAAFLLPAHLLAQIEERYDNRGTREDRLKRNAIPHLKYDRAVFSGIHTRYGMWLEAREILQRRREIRGVRNLTLEQIIAYDRLKSQSPSLKVHWSNAGLPIFMTAMPLSSSIQAGGAVNKQELQRAADEFIGVYAALLRIDPERTQFIVTRTDVSKAGYTSVRLDQYIDGIRAWDAEIILQFDASGHISLFAGRYTDKNDTPLPASLLSETEILETIRSGSDVRGTTLAPTWDKHPAFIAEDLIELYYVSRLGQYAYCVEVLPAPTARLRYFVDPQTGEILEQYNATCFDGPDSATAADLAGTDRELHTYLHQGQYYLLDATRQMFDDVRTTLPYEPVGAIWTLDAQNTDLESLFPFLSSDNTWSDPKSVSAHYNAMATYEYYESIHGRNSLDGAGGGIHSVVNITLDGQPLRGAFWNGRFIGYGNGSADYLPAAGALDIAAHEMTHAVIEHSADFEYINQSGALHEAFADVFGVMLDREDWQLGEDITPVNTEYPSGALRDLSDPSNSSTMGSPGWQPSHMDNFQNLPITNDNGGVHINSSIPGHVAYLVAEGMGMEKMEQVFYDALTKKLTRSANFVDFRLAIIQSATELYGQMESNICADACDDVGIFEGNGGGVPDTYQPVDGIDRMVYVSRDEFDENYYWTVRFPAQAAEDFASLSVTPPLSRASIPDDGSVAFFVDTEFNLRLLSLDLLSPGEFVISDAGIWNSVAVSKDGGRLALTTTALEAQIHLMNIASGDTSSTVTFDLYAPNYSHGDVPHTVAYADRLDFNQDSEYVLFDCLNELSINGNDYEYWDINLIHLWDAESNMPGTGRIERVFSQDPQFNLSNPSFAETNSAVFTFDVTDKFTNQAFIYTSNMHTNDVVNVREINHIDFGYPAYNGDDRLLSYSTPALEFGGEFVIYNIPMLGNRIEVAGEPEPYVFPASEPVWYRQGQRPVSLDEIPQSSSSIVLEQNYPNPFNPSTTIRFHLIAGNRVSLKVYDSMGRMIRTLLGRSFPAGTHSVQWDGRNDAGDPVASGTYIYRLESGSTVQSNAMTLIR